VRHIGDYDAKPLTLDERRAIARDTQTHGVYRDKDY